MKTQKISTEMLVQLRALGLPQPEGTDYEGMYVTCPNTSGEGLGVSHGVYHPSLGELLDFVAGKQKGAQVVFECAKYLDENCYFATIIEKEGFFKEGFFPSYRRSGNSWEEVLAVAMTVISP